jgi:hypothetical protein
LRKETRIHEMVLNKKEELAIWNWQFFWFKNRKKRDKNERNKQKKKLKDEGKKRKWGRIKQLGKIRF